MPGCSETSFVRSLEDVSLEICFKENYRVYKQPSMQATNQNESFIWTKLDWR